MLFAASEVETAGERLGVSPAVSGLLGGMTGGVAQAYATMGVFIEIVAACFSIFFYLAHS